MFAQDHLEPVRTRKGDPTAYRRAKPHDNKQWLAQDRHAVLPQYALDKYGPASLVRWHINRDEMSVYRPARLLCKRQGPPSFAQHDRHQGAADKQLLRYIQGCACLWCAIRVILYVSECLKHQFSTGYGCFIGGAIALHLDQLLPE